MPQPLLALISSDVKETDVTALRRMVDEMRRGWTFGDPTFVDHLDNESGTRPEDLPVRTLGVTLRVSRPGELPRTSVAELSRFVDAVTGFSLLSGVELEFELDGQFAGDVRNGVPSRTLRDGLLASWRGAWA